MRSKVGLLGETVMNATVQSGRPEAREWLNTLRADPRRAIGEDAISCLICGRTFRQLTNTHLRGHGSEAPEYKRRFGYNRGRPLMCHALHRFYAERAVRSRLAARIRARPILVRPELRRLGGARAIALEEWLTRRDARRKSDATGVLRPQQHPELWRIAEAQSVTSAAVSR